MQVHVRHKAQKAKSTVHQAVQKRSRQSSHSRHQSAAGERVRALHELGLYVCVDAAGQLSVPHEARLHSQPTGLDSAGRRGINVLYNAGQG